MQICIFNENGVTLKALEKIIYKYACNIACNAMKQVLENLDKKLLEERDSKVYRNKGLKRTCIKTIMGDVEYSRRIYQYVLEDGWNVVQTVGTKIKEIEERKIKLNEKGVLNGDKETEVLFQEQDGLWLSIQGKDKPKG